MSSNSCQSIRKHPSPLSVHHPFKQESEYTWLVTCTAAVHWRIYSSLLYSILIPLVWAGKPKQNWGETMGFIHWDTVSRVTVNRQDWRRDPGCELSQAAGGGSWDLGWEPGAELRALCSSAVGGTWLFQSRKVCKQTSGPRGSVTGGCGSKGTGELRLWAQTAHFPSTLCTPRSSFSPKELCPSADFQLCEAMNHSCHESQFLNMRRGRGIN